MQSVRSRIWTRIAVSISYDDNDTGTSIDESTEKELVWMMNVFEFLVEIMLSAIPIAYVTLAV